MAYVYQELGKYLSLNKNEIDIKKKYWLEKQWQYNYDMDKSMLSKNTTDPNILASRLYEAFRIK